MRVPIFLEKVVLYGRLAREYFPRNIFSEKYTCIFLGIFPGKGDKKNFLKKLVTNSWYRGHIISGYGGRVYPLILGRGEWGPESVKQYVKMIFDVKYFHNCTLILTGNFSTLHTNIFSRWFRIDLFTNSMRTILTRLFLSWQHEILSEVCLT